MSSDGNGQIGGENWFALRVRPNHEKRVAELMGAGEFLWCLPVQQVRRRWSQRWKDVEVPLFPGYVFACFGREQWPRIMNVPGVVDAVRFGKTLAPVDRDEIEALRTAERAACELAPSPYLPAGEKICIREGPLAGLNGTVAEDQGRAHLILSVTLLQRSVRVTIERDLLEVERAAA